jgi:AcrR family transcriptional regulator
MIATARWRGGKVKSRAPASAGPRTDRRSRQGAQSRLRILEATFALAHELGYQGTSISKVVERSGVPASSVYWHFADKDALFEAMIQHSFEQWRLMMRESVVRLEAGRRREAVRTGIRSAVDSIAASPEFWRLGLMLSLERQPIERKARQRFKEIRRHVIDSAAAFWRRILPDGHDKHVPELLARFTMATADGLFVSAQIDGEGDYRRLADLLVDSLEAAAARLTRRAT